MGNTSVKGITAKRDRKRSGGAPDTAAWGQVIKDAWEGSRKTMNDYSPDEKVQIKELFNNLIEDHTNLGDILFDKKYNENFEDKWQSMTDADKEKFVGELGAHKVFTFQGDEDDSEYGEEDYDDGDETDLRT